MKDRLKYVIDSRYFDGTCLTSMSDGFHNDYGEETIEELRIRENNPYLKAVTPSDIDKPKSGFVKPRACISKYPICMEIIGYMIY